MDDGSAGLRVDRWLWTARLVKSRTLGSDLVRGGHVEVNGQRVKPGREIHPGDRLEVTFGDSRRTLIVRGVAERRGPASAAALLYEETAESIDERERAAMRRRLSEALGPGGGARPTKRDRRRLDATRPPRERG